MSFPPGTEMFQFPGFASTAYVFSCRYPIGVGCPIRISTDQRLLAAPRGFSQRATSFIASWCQGIHRMPFSRSRTSEPPERSSPPCTGTIPNKCQPNRQHHQKQNLRTQRLAQHTTLHASERSARLLMGHPIGQTSQPGTPRDAPEPDSHYQRTHPLKGRQRTQETPPPPGKRYPQTRNPHFSAIDPNPRTTHTWWRRSGSNRRPPACKAGALPAELQPRYGTTTASPSSLDAGALCGRLAGVNRRSKGGDPAAPSDTATLLRLHPSHEPHRGRRPPRG